jgi:hypothetical protein
MRLTIIFLCPVAGGVSTKTKMPQNTCYSYANGVATDKEMLYIPTEYSCLTRNLVSGTISLSMDRHPTIMLEVVFCTRTIERK